MRMVHVTAGGGLSWLVLLSLLQPHSSFLRQQVPASRRAPSLPDLCSPRSSRPLTPTFSNAPQGGDGTSAAGIWKLPNDYRQFLNQICIQSFLILVASLRDPQTVRWVDNFTRPAIPSDRTSPRWTGTTDATQAIAQQANNHNAEGKSYSQLLTYHGLGAMNTTLFPTWDAYFAALLEQPKQLFLVQSSGVQVQDYELEINPASLCSRLVSVREQIAAEMAHDLQVVANVLGQETMDHYWDYLDDDGETQQYTTNEVTMSTGDDHPRRLPPHNLVFLEYSLDSLGDRIPSPLRKGNFDLVVLLATQESIHRILNHQQTEPAGKDFGICQKYLLDFYAERLVSHFSGIQRYGRADDFLEELLFSSPRVSTGDGCAALVDPVRIAEMILHERKQVALEWSAMSQDVPNDHIAIKRLQLNALMQSYQ